MNAINVIQPYKYLTMWVFDDERVGLVQEPFVSGTDEIIDEMVATIPNAEEGFVLLFSTTPFPGHQAVFEWRREEGGENWYYIAALDKEGGSVRHCSNISVRHRKKSTRNSRRNNAGSDEL